MLPVDVGTSFEQLVHLGRFAGVSCLPHLLVGVRHVELTAKAQRGTSIESLQYSFNRSSVEIRGARLRHDDGIRRQRA